METQAPKREFAWQPFTPRGVSLFVSTSFARLFSIQFAFSLFAASVMVWFLNHSWFPTITAAIKQLPAEGEIRNGKLAWPADSPARLAESHFLAFSVDLQHEGQARSPSHLLVEFGGSDLKIFSLLGYVQSIYPKTWRIAFNQPELEPAWGAWAPPLLGLAACAVVAGLM